MFDQKKKSKEQIEAERAEIERIRSRLMQMTDICPKAVISGSYQKAVSWKKEAIEARKLAESKNPSLGKLQNALSALQPFYSEGR